MKIETFIKDWIAISNGFETEKYLDFYLPEAVLDDPSVGRKFYGRVEIKEYFDNYFIRYNTYIELLKLTKTDEQNAHIVVEFTGDFPEGKIKGTFEYKLNGDKIIYLKADLI